MTELTEADQALALALITTWFENSASHKIAEAEAKHVVFSNHNLASNLAQTARRLVTAELAAKAIPNEKALIDAMVGVHGPEAFISDPCEVMGDALDAIAPHLAALQARAARAEAERDAIAVENARIRQAIRAALENRYDSAYAALYSAHASARAALEITSPDTEG